MARQKLVVRRAEIRALWDLMKKMGEEPVEIKLHDDGTFRIMTRKHVEAKYGTTAHPVSNP